MFILNTNKNFFAIIINVKIGEKIMKKLAILGSAKSCVLEDILKYFNGKDVEITCLSDDEHCEFFKKAKELNENTKLLPYEINVEYLLLKYALPYNSWFQILYVVLKKMALFGKNIFQLIKKREMFLSFKFYSCSLSFGVAVVGSCSVLFARILLSSLLSRCGIIDFKIMAFIFLLCLKVQSFLLLNILSIKS